MKRTWTIIGVADVARSLGWYQSLFGKTLGMRAFLRLESWPGQARE